MAEEILKIENLNVSFSSSAGIIRAVRSVSLSVKRGEILALVGESGCGKSSVAQAVLRLHSRENARIEAQCLELSGVDVLSASERELASLRGKLSGMVFQDPMTCLNPSMKIGKQITEGALRRGELKRREAKEEAIRLLKLVEIPEPELRAQQYPYQFSGGMRQRVMLAMALSSSPGLLIADEPTTALDVTVQRRLLLLLKNLRDKTGCGILLISHDLSLVANLAERVAVMYAGRIVEEGPVETVLMHPAHPYTKGLLACVPVPGMEGELPTIPGTPPKLTTAIEGCAFANRCQYKNHECGGRLQELDYISADHRVACSNLYCGGGE